MRAIGIIPVALLLLAIKLNSDAVLPISHEVVVTVERKFEVINLDVEATGYNSLPNQTDDTPFITATGDSVFWGGIAVSRPLLVDNLLPYGSIVLIEGYDTPFIVFDTMNARFKNYKVDLWFKDFDDAWRFGVRKLNVTKIGKLPRDKIPTFPILLAGICNTKKRLL